ncbi:hypothetical protein [Lactobacillus sp.]|uniref:hypothetical protein n=1 Tax=Lactobacillus sp. TaxID=1591 RepID=UPI00258AA993|nr:hypothetical protein [Lactobacillus sp.]MCO6529094.1 hypothetical protein [Lactobacillus sp.]
MTLSNIFFGKKVVQQAYLNNALIYQSKGWETLPSTCSEVWTKELGIVNTDTVNQCLTDSNNNIYVLTHYQIFKLNSEGTLIWSQTITGIQRIAIDTDNDVYITFADINYSYIAKLDNNGNIENKFKASGDLCNVITNFTVDGNYFYLSGNYNNNSNYYFFKIDKQGKLINQIDLELNESTLVEDDLFLYAGLRNNLIKIDKSNIFYVTVFTPPTNLTYNITNVFLDGLGNAIVIDESETVYKYNFENNLSTKYSLNTIYSNFTATLDYQKNLYFIWGESQNNIVNNIVNVVDLIKYSSDGTLIFNTQILKDKSSAILNGKLSADNNGNIYYLYTKYDSNLNYNLIVKKLINIEQKGN